MNPAGILEAEPMYIRGACEDAARGFEVGGVMINDIPTFRADHMPYGGVKQNGTGRDGPRYAMIVDLL
jgi:acyl-CoA reductase-like NAD-dependent aldehyde dehydrogenase